MEELKSGEISIDIPRYSSESEIGETKSKKILMDIFKYSLGGLGVTLATNLTMSYLNFFLTDVFGITAFSVAGIMLVSRVVDAITDPVMGIGADRTKSRWGKFRPWMIFFAPVLGFAVFLLFYTPNIPESMKVIYAYGVFIFYSIAITIVSIPYFALVPVISKDSHTRTIIISWKSVMCQVAVLCISTFALPMVNMFGGGQKGWSTFGGIVGVAATIFVWIAADGAKAHDISSNTEVSKNTKNENKEENNFKILLKTKPLLVLVTAFGLSMFANTLVNSANMYYFKYILNKQNWIPTVMAVSMGASILASMILPKIEGIFGKKKAFIYSTLICIIPLILLGLNPNVTSIYSLLAQLILFGFMYGIASALPWAMIPDCIDYAEWKYGVQPNGLFTATFTFVQKCGIAIGGFLSSFLLGMAGFVANKDQVESSIKMIISLRFIIPAMLFLLVVVVLYFYEITPERTKEISKELEKRRDIA